MVKEKQELKYIEFIEFFEPNYLNSIINQIPDFNNLKFNKKQKEVKKIIGRFVAAGKRSRKFWTQRGWSEEEADYKRKDCKYKTRKPDTSPFSIGYWLNKGFSEEEADYKRNSLRPFYKEHWMEKGFSEEEAIKQLSKSQSNISKKTSEKYTKAERRVFSHRCKEHWMEKGFSEEEAIKKVKEYQSTFSIKKCIKKYGEEEGTRIWQARQDKWQETLNSKPQEEIDDINRRKNPLYNIEEIELEEYIKSCEKKNIPCIITENDLKKFLIEKYITNLCKYKPKEYLYKIIPRFIKRLSFFSQIYNIICLNLEFNSEEIFKNPRGYYNMYSKEGKLLRSSKEIHFYNLLLKYNIKYEIEKYYNNSTLISDFYLPEYSMWIELAGFMNDEKYKQKMLYKKETFGSIIIDLPNYKYESWIKENILDEKNINY